MSLPIINSYTNWAPLEEVWLGDVYPASWYDHLSSEVRDCFHEITEKTQQDLAVIHHKLEELGVHVVRPEYHNIEDFMDPRGYLRKPDITPRDNFLVYQNTLLGNVMSWKNPWKSALDRYRRDSRCHIAQPPEFEHLGWMCGANTVRVGNDLYLDIMPCHSKSTNEQKHQEFVDKVAPLWPNSRIHLLANGGHVDGCFAVAKPGVLITSRYFDAYDRTFPGWYCLNIAKPEFFDRRHAAFRAGPGHNGKWFVQGMADRLAFQEHVIKHALDWIGDYTETFFEVNCLVVDEKNILMLGENEKVARELERQGITVHWMPFRTRTFWDGGLHCLTLDIRRRDSAVDLFPERGSQQVFTY
jgi:N-dimethylarginine dimethylaminohydrolase